MRSTRSRTTRTTKAKKDRLVLIQRYHTDVQFAEVPHQAVEDAGR